MKSPLDRALLALIAVMVIALGWIIAGNLEQKVIGVDEECQRIISWNFVASGVIFVCSSMFQAMGNTVPSLVSSFVRIVLVAVPAFLLARRATGRAGGTRHE